MFSFDVPAGQRRRSLSVPRRAPTSTPRRARTGAGVYRCWRSDPGRPSSRIARRHLTKGQQAMAAATGASTKELMARMGHASPAAALRYQHATADRNRQVAEALGDALSRRSS